MSALVVRNVSKRFGGVLAVSDISMVVEPGERRLIIGPNGAGKTTYFNMLAGATGVTTGHIEFFGQDITLLAAHARARLGLSRTFQITNLFPRLSVVENLLLSLQALEAGAFSLTRRMRANRALYDRAGGLLADWGLTDIAERPAREISYGEKRQVDLILAMAAKPRLLLLDEPAAGLSAAETARLVGMVRSLPRDMTILMIEHDMDVAFDLVDQVSVLHQGRLVVEGDGETVRGHPVVTEIYLGVD